VNNAVNLDACDGSTLQRREQNTAECVAKRGTKAALKRFNHQFRNALWIAT